MEKFKPFSLCATRRFEEDNVIEFGNEIKFELNSDNSIQATIPGIVGSQQEWLVKTSDMIYLFDQMGFKLDHLRRATGSSNLNSDQIEYTNLFSYGRFNGPKYVEEKYMRDEEREYGEKQKGRTKFERKKPETQRPTVQRVGE